jgi:cytidylate kinase
VAWLARSRAVDPADAAGVAALARTARFDLGEAVVVDGHDVTRDIRTTAIDAAAAIVARHPDVRRALVDRQRSYAGEGGLVMEGRDIGTVVFPHADLKLYIDASAEERARRRASDPAHTGSHSNIVDVRSDMAARDQSDSTRSVAPLLKADDAIYLDTTAMPIDSVVERVVALIHERLG